MKKLYILFAITCTFLAQSYAQENIILSEPIYGGIHEFEATQSIKMVPGFSYAPVAAADRFSAKINPFILTPPEEGITGGPDGFDDIVGNDGIVGATNGSFAVSENGQATYVVPLEFPGGIGGMTPDLSLVYNSNGGDGILGPGWSLAGLSVISLVPPTRYHNGIKDASKGLDYIENNYMLDGQRLFLVQKAEDSNDNWIFKKENDDFSRITRFITPGKENTKDDSSYSFEVKTKGGLTYVYGKSPKSRQTFTGVNNKINTVNYYIEEIIDNYGNTIRFDYSKTIATGEFYLNKIDYTFTTETNRDDTAIYSIKFDYKERNSPILTNFLYPISTTPKPISFTSNKLISNIVCKHNESSTIVKKYELQYQNRGPFIGGTTDYRNFFLKSVQEVGLNNEKYNKTVFEWEQEMSYNSFQNSTFELPELIYKPHGPQGDADLTRFVRHLNNFFIDLDHDGEKELIRAYEAIRSYALYGSIHHHYHHDLIIEVLKKNENNSFVLTNSFVFNDHMPTYSQDYHLGGPRFTHVDFIFEDFTGNGDIDLIANNTYTTHRIPDYTTLVSNVHFYQNLGGTWDFGSNSEILNPTGWIHFSTSLGDFNGDGIADILLQRIVKNSEGNSLEGDGELAFRLGNTTEPLQSSNDSKNEVILNYSTSSKIQNNIQVIDINGDGRSEILEIEAENQKKIYSLRFSSDNNLNLINNQITTNFPIKELYFCQINTDKKVDIIDFMNLDVTPNYTGMGYDGRYKVILQMRPFKGNGNGDFTASSAFVLHQNLFTPTQFYEDFENVSRNISISTLYLSDITNNGQSEIYIKYVVSFYFTDNSGNPQAEHYYFDLLLFPNKEGNDYTIMKVPESSSIPIFNSKNIPINFTENHQPDFYKVDSPYSTAPILKISSPSQQGTAISRIINGLGNEVLIDYGFSSDPEVYTSNFSDEYDYPVMPFRHPLKLVKNVKSSNGTGGYFEEAYHYENALVHAEGKGFLGFEKTIRTNVTQGMKQITEYGVETNDNLYYVYPKKTTNKLLDNTKISESTHVFNHFFPNTLINDPDTPTHNHFIYESSRTSTTWDLEGTMLKAERVKNEKFDNFGNLERTRTEIAPNPDFIYDQTFEILTTQKYDNFEENWILGKLYEAKVTKRAPGQPIITRESDFMYYPDSIHMGMLQEEIVEPNNPKYKTTKTYEYDIFGNIVRTVLSADDDTFFNEDRINESSYDTDSKNIPGRFLTEMRTLGINEVDLIEKREYDPLLANLIKVTDPNNLVTHFKYNGFGQLQNETMHDGNQTQTVLRWVLEGDEDAPEHAVYYSWSATSGAAPVKVYFSGRGKELRNVTTGFDGTLVYVDTQYDNKGRILKKSEPYFKNTTPVYTQYTQYDELNRPKRVKHPDNSETSFAYNGLATTTTNALGQTNSKTINVAGWLVRSEDADGHAVIQTYRSDGLVTSRFIQGGPQTMRTYDYDIVGNLVHYFDRSQGNLEYEYDAFGQLRKSWNAHEQLTTYDYDRLGRLTEKILPEGTKYWNYHNETDKLGLLQSVLLDDGNQIIHSVTYNNYDEMGRPLKITEVIANEPEDFVKSFTYDNYGRLQNYTYPITGVTIENQYNSYGYQDRVVNTANNQTLWEANSMNARKQFTGVKFGNNINQTFVYHNPSGRLHRILAGSLQEEEYQWDPIGNLLFRKSRNGFSEIFQYDNLNRLKIRSHIDYGEGILYSDSVIYDLLGNITYKTSVGNYQYDIENPYKLEFINGMPAHIDPNKYEITYNSFNKVTNVTKAHGGPVYALSAEMNLFYGVDNQRIKQTINQITEGLETSKIYVGGDFEKHIENGEVKYVHFIHSPQGLIAIMEQDADGNQEMNYVLKDHLGSIQVLIDEQGDIVQEFSYDPWGMRRCPQTWELYYNISDYLTDRGFTGHEHMDLFMLVNMNGRIYDPLVGRFLSPDPVLQFPDYTQGLNPYAYALNNPLRFVDPNGYSLVGNFLAITASIAFTSIGMPILGLITSSLILTIDQQIESRNSIPFIESFYANLLSSVISYGFTKSIGGFWDERISKNNKFIIELGRAGTHALFNGGMRMAQGGKFEHGFLSGFVSSLGGSYMQAQAPHMNATTQIILSAAFGGTAEWLGGGKFANGAVTGAYVMMFNHLRDEIEDRRFKRRNWLTATWIRNNPFSWTYGAEAIFGDIGFQILGAEQDVGLVFILAGEQKGQLYTYHEYVEKFGISIDANFPGAEIGRIDVFGIKPSEFEIEMMIGEYNKAWFSAPIVGASFSWAKPDIGITIISTAFTFGIGGGLIKGFGGGFNIGNFRLLND